MSTEPRPSFIQNLFSGGRRKRQQDEEADRELDGALVRLCRAFDENGVASDGVRRRQSSGSLKLLSLSTEAE